MNECRVALGFQEVEEVLLWEFGGPLPYGLFVEENLAIPPEWVAKIQKLPGSAQLFVTQLLKTNRFRSERRRDLRDRVVVWLDESEVELHEFLTHEEAILLRGVANRKISVPISQEEKAQRGRYYIHLRWHKNKPKPSCEFCTQVVSSR